MSKVRNLRAWLATLPDDAEITCEIRTRADADEHLEDLAARDGVDFVPLTDEQWRSIVVQYEDTGELDDFYEVVLWNVGGWEVSE